MSDPRKTALGANDNEFPLVETALAEALAGDGSSESGPLSGADWPLIDGPLTRLPGGAGHG